MIPELDFYYHDKPEDNVIIIIKTFIHWLSSVLSIPDEGYSRNESYVLRAVFLTLVNCFGFNIDGMNLY
jgi:hypothetical protein